MLSADQMDQIGKFIEAGLPSK